MTQNEFCKDSTLRWLLQLPEDSREIGLASSHIEGCAYCQRRLAELAGSDDDWREAHACLEADHEEDGVADIECDTADHWQAWLHPPHSTDWSEAMLQQMLSPPSHPEMLGRIGRYEIERFIGAGGMGGVFKAFDTELNRPVAIKVLAPHLTIVGAARQRFAREARAAAAIVHEHVVAIHNVETDQRAPFLVMQYVAGESLQSRIDREGPLDLCEILRIGMQTAAGLAAAHAQGLVHRDVKPSNILLEKGVERTLLTDFGLARATDDASLTHTGFHPGTPQYMSPEQARGDVIDARSDLFSLGSVLYTMCTGRVPFRAETSYGILRRITDSEPRPLREINPKIPEWLENIIARLHAKSVSQRFKSASELRDVLEQCLAHTQQPTSTPLPEICFTSSASSSERHDSLRSLKNALWPIAAHRRWTWLSLLLAMSLTLLGLKFFIDGQPRLALPNMQHVSGSADQVGVSHQKSTSNAQLSDERTALAEWNPLQSDLDQFSDDWQSFEHHLDDAWDSVLSRRQ
jgi:eukaryotic-like serine/threonine-protein kinase